MKVAFCSSEVFPFAKTGGLADVCGALPLALENLGVQVVIFMPMYKNINIGEQVPAKINDSLSRLVIGEGVEVFFIENSDFFYRDNLYGDTNGDYSDNLERFQFYCRQVFKNIEELNLDIDIIHCHDWQASLIPVYLKEKYADKQNYSKIKSVLTIHNLAFQGIFPKEKFPVLGLDAELFNTSAFEFFGQINLLKAGIIYCDKVTTVSENYAKQIQTKEFGCGLEDVLRSKTNGVVGILNGVDYKIWNPESDKFIYSNYSSVDYLWKKAENKSILQQKFNLKEDDDIPLFGFVGRLCQQKGLDLISEIIKEPKLPDIQIIIQGIGEERYHNLLTDLAQQYPDKLAICFEFDEKTAHQIYAGADMFLMPSEFEPCGLSQMISLRYGTIPIVFHTGGLADTIIDYNENNYNGNGFVFKDYNKEAFADAIRRAIEFFKDTEHRAKLIGNAFGADFSWDKSAYDYYRLYKECMDMVHDDE